MTGKSMRTHKSLPKPKIKTGDEVIVIAGKDKGRLGKVKRVIKADPRHVKVVVDGIQMVTRNLRANPQLGIESQQIQIEHPIDISNVAIYNPVTRKKDKVSFARLEDGRKVRVYRSTGEQIDVQVDKQ